LEWKYLLIWEVHGYKESVEIPFGS